MSHPANADTAMPASIDRNQRVREADVQPAYPLSLRMAAEALWDVQPATTGWHGQRPHR